MRCTSRVSVRISMIVGMDYDDIDSIVQLCIVDHAERVVRVVAAKIA